MFLRRANAHQNLVCYTSITETFYHSQTVSILKGTSDLSTVGGRIQYYRLLNGLYQEDVANRSGIDRTTIIRYENNQLVPSLDLCNKIAEAIGIDPYLIYDEYLTFIASDFGNKIKLIRFYFYCPYTLLINLSYQSAQRITPTHAGVISYSYNL